MTSQQNSASHGKSKPKKPAPKKITESYLHNAGLYYLQRFATGTENFRRIMTRKAQKSCAAHPDQDMEMCKAMIGNLISKFTDLGLLNDEIYTRGAVTSLRCRGKSERHIHQHLRAKGIAPDLILQLLTEIKDTDEEAAFILARKKRLGPFRGNKEKNEKKELATFARAGFSYETARKIMQAQDTEPPSSTPA